jgi:PST family polysaccharide transporter
MTLSSHTGRGVAWMASGETARQVTHLVAGIVLARLLTPADYGLIAMALFVVGFMQAIARCGLTNALISRQEVTDDDWSSVYWIEVGLGLAVWVMAWILAPVAGSLYRDERVIQVVRVAGSAGFLASLGTTQEAWLRKRMQFRMIAQMEWAGILAGAVTAVAMALAGWAVWSLVAQMLVGSAVTALALCMTCPWRPALRIRFSALGWAVRFGIGLQGFGIVNFLNRRLDDALIGRYVGPDGLGQYTRAYQLMLYPTQTIAGHVVGRVVFPALAAIGDDLPRFRAAYLRAVSAIATVTFPAMLGLLVTAAEVIPLLYGPQWVAAVPLLQVLCIVGLIQSIQTTTGWIYLARARTGLFFIWGVAEAVVIYSSFLVGIQWGVMGVAVAYAAANGLLLVPNLAVPFRLIHLPIRDLLRSVIGVLVGSGIMAAIVAAVRAVMLAREAGPGLVLAASVTSGILIYLAWLWLTEAWAAREARLVWSRFVGLHRSGVLK